jgi:hypothetical protein
VKELCTNGGLRMDFTLLKTTQNIRILVKRTCVGKYLKLLNEHFDNWIRRYEKPTLGFLFN